MSEKQISVDDLTVGMYLTGMDKPWWETPFLLHKFLLKSEGEIEKIRDCDVREVTIDISKGKDVAIAPKPVEAAVAVLDDPQAVEDAFLEEAVSAVELEPEPEPEPEISFSYEDVVVLIADDDEFGRQILSKQIKKMFGCGVIEAEHGGRAITLLHEQFPDLLILDLMMQIGRAHV